MKRLVQKTSVAAENTLRQPLQQGFCFMQRRLQAHPGADTRKLEQRGQYLAVCWSSHGNDPRRLENLEEVWAVTGAGSVWRQQDAMVGDGEASEKEMSLCWDR